MTIEELKKNKYALTHAGSFHSDDVFSAAFLLLINPDIKIIRSFDIPNNFDGIVFDIGFGKFDHHQIDNEVRKNGIPYASFGKLWKTFAPFLYSNEVCNNIDKKLIQDLDLSDNTGKENALAYAISLFNPVWDSDSNGDSEFMEAVLFAKSILKNLILKEEKGLEAKKYVFDSYEKSIDKRIVILDKHMPFKDVLPSTEAIYVIYPSNRGGFCVQAVTKSSDTTEMKLAFPEEWTRELPSYLKFCHNSRFLVTTNTLEEALNACDIALKII